MVLTWSSPSAQLPYMVACVPSCSDTGAGVGYSVDWARQYNTDSDKQYTLISVDLSTVGFDIEGILYKLRFLQKGARPYVHVLVRVPRMCPQWGIAKTFLKTPLCPGNRVTVVTEDVRIFRKLSCKNKLWLKSISRKSFQHLVKTSEKGYPDKFTGLLWQLYQYTPDSLLNGLTNPLPKGIPLTYTRLYEEYGYPYLNVHEVFVAMLQAKRTLNNRHVYLRKFSLHVHNPTQSKQITRELIELSRVILTLKGILPEDRENYAKHSARHLMRYVDKVDSIPLHNVLYFLTVAPSLDHENLLLGYFGD